MDEGDIEYSGFVNPENTDQKYMVTKDKFVRFSGKYMDQYNYLLIKLLSDPNVAYFSPREDGESDAHAVEIIIHYKDGRTLATYPEDPGIRRNPYKRNYLTLDRSMFKNPENPGVYKVLDSVPPLKRTAAESVFRSRQVPEPGTPERDIYDRAITAGRRRKVKRKRTKRKLRIPKRKGK